MPSRRTEPGGGELSPSRLRPAGPTMNREKVEVGARGIEGVVRRSTDWNLVVGESGRD